MVLNLKIGLYLLLYVLSVLFLPFLFNHMVSLNSSYSSLVGTVNDALYKELWHACAGPLVNVPREQERVYYFPQGHMEQVEL